MEKTKITQRQLDTILDAVKDALVESHDSAFVAEIMSANIESASATGKRSGKSWCSKMYKGGKDAAQYAALADAALKDALCVLGNCEVETVTDKSNGKSKTTQPTISA